MKLSKKEQEASPIERLVSGLEVGDEAVLTGDIVEPACGDHPAFLMGRLGETVVIREIRQKPGWLPYLVEGPTNPGQTWWAGYSDLIPKAH